MGEIVDLIGRRRSADEPDAAHVFRDFRPDRVDTFYEFMGSYEFDGEAWRITVWARDWSEAERKLAAISGGRIDGQLMTTQPA